jgi:uncharacterized damage-inducible protein DinB
MSTIPSLLKVTIPSGYRSQEVASFIAQLDDQTRRLTEDTRGLSIEDLEWQPAPGMNTIGMLLAHNAIVEVFWCGVVFEGFERDQVPIHDVLGIGSDDDGMPLKEGGAPPDVLKGKSLDFYDDLLVRARTHLKKILARVEDANLTDVVHRTNPAGGRRDVEARWTLYHILEHYCGHYGQVLLLRHLRRATQESRATVKA